MRSGIAAEGGGGAGGQSPPGSIMTFEKVGLHDIEKILDIDISC